MRSANSAIVRNLWLPPASNERFSARRGCSFLGNETTRSALVTNYTNVILFRLYKYVHYAYV